MTIARRSGLPRLLLVIPLVVLGTSGLASQPRVLADPMQAFVDGYDPSDSDFFVLAQEQTILVLVRADFDNDGVLDLAVSEQSPWGKAGGPWLVFLGERGGGFAYTGTLFFAPGARRMALHPVRAGVGEVIVFSPVRPGRGTLAIYRLSRAGSQAVRTTADLADDDADVTAAFRGATTPAAEACVLIEYRRDRTGCWHPYGARPSAAVAAEPGAPEAT